MNAPERAIFLANRKAGLGGTDISAIMGLNPWRSPVDVYMDKMGLVPDSDSAMRLRFGSQTEDFVAKEYELATGRKTLRHNLVLRSEQYPYAIGNIDRLVVPEGAKIAAHRGEIRTDRMLECKTVGGFASRSDEWGAPGTDEIPTHYLLQTHWYLSLTPCTVCDLAALVGAGEDLKIYTIKKDKDLEEELLRQGHEWWVKHIIGGVMPEPRSEHDVSLLFPRSTPDKSIDANTETLELIERAKELRAQIATLETALEGDKKTGETGLVGQLKVLMADASILRLGDEVLATWKSNKDSNKIDWEAVAKELQAPADLISKYTTTKAGARPFYFK